MATNQQSVSKAWGNASLYVLRGKRSGKVYRVPNTGKTYRASAPGEPPAVRSGTSQR